MGVCRSRIPVGIKGIGFSCWVLWFLMPTPPHLHLLPPPPPPPCALLLPTERVQPLWPAHPGQPDHLCHVTTPIRLSINAGLQRDPGSSVKWLVYCKILSDCERLCAQTRLLPLYSFSHSNKITTQAGEIWNECNDTTYFTQRTKLISVWIAPNIPSNHFYDYFQPVMRH